MKDQERVELGAIYVSDRMAFVALAHQNMMHRHCGDVAQMGDERRSW